MNTFTTSASAATRLMFAAAAISTTLALFSSVISLSEPQRSVLIAKTNQRDSAQPTGTVLAVAMAAPAAKTTSR